MCRTCVELNLVAIESNTRATKMHLGFRGRVCVRLKYASQKEIYMRYFIRCFIFSKMVSFERCRVIALLSKLEKERRRQLEIQRVILLIIVQSRNFLLKVSIKSG